MNKDENELDLTDFVPSGNRKTPMNESDIHCQTPTVDRREFVTREKKKNRSLLFGLMFRKTRRNDQWKVSRTKLSKEKSNLYVIYSSGNPFERETPFRQSISEKRRLTQQANTSAVQWKQQSFHETRTNSERSKFPFSLSLEIFSSSIACLS